MTVGRTHSVAFAPLSEPGPNYELPGPRAQRAGRAVSNDTAAATERAPEPEPALANPLDALRAIRVDIQTLVEKLSGSRVKLDPSGIVASETRHGDLQVMLSACQRIAEQLERLIAAEEV